MVVNVCFIGGMLVCIVIVIYELIGVDIYFGIIFKDICILVDFMM